MVMKFQVMVFWVVIPCSGRKTMF